MTAPIQPPASTASPVRAAKNAPQTNGLPFNDILSKEVSQRSPELSPAEERRATASTARTEQAPKSAGRADETVDKGGETEKDIKNEPAPADGVIAAAPPEILALVADISQLTGKLLTGDATSAAIVETGTKTGRQPIFSIGKPDLLDNAAETIQPDGLSAAEPDIAADAKGQNFTTAFLRTAPAGAETIAGGTRAQDVISASSPSSLNAIVPMLQASAAFSAQVAAPAADKLTPPVGTPAWDQALGNKVVWMAGTAVQTASLSLNPPDLGPLQVVLNVSNSQATATFSAAQPEVRQALEAAMPRLRDMMQEAGIQLGEATVDAGTSNRQEMADRGAQPGYRRPAGADMPSGVEQAAPHVRQQAISRGQGLVDTFA